MSSPSRVYALVEDQRQRQLLYRFLLKAGVSPHQVQFELSPSGQGSAEQWVRENFARQLGKCRARNARAATSMFVMLDADVARVDERLHALDESLVSAGQARFDTGRDPVARLVPKRNVETWILYLSTKGIVRSAINEEQDYKQTKTGDEWSKLIPAAAEVLHTWTTNVRERPPNLIDSLRCGIQEIPRALPANV